MNIIFYRYDSICEPDYIEAFKKLGLEVVEDLDGWDGNESSISDKLGNLRKLVLEKWPLFIFSINYFPFISLFCDRMNIMYLAESVDCPVLQIFHESIKSKVNKVFLFDKMQCLSIQKENPGGVFYMPLGAPCERVAELLGDSTSYAYDVSFVGSLYKEKNPFLNLKLSSENKLHFDKLVNKQMEEKRSGLDYLDDNIQADDIDIIKKSTRDFQSSTDLVMNMDKYIVLNEYLAPHIAYIERVDILNSIADCIGNGKLHIFTGSQADELSDGIINHGVAKSFSQMPHVYRNSKINLNITMRAIRTGLPQRIWDVMACRGFLITNNQDEIKDFFIPGVHLETYDDKEELLEKIQYYLEHEDIREKIAQKGYEEVCEKHTVLMRTARMMKQVFFSKET